MQNRRSSAMRSTLDTMADSLVRRPPSIAGGAHPLATHQTLRAAGPRTYILALARTFPCLRCKVAHLTPDTWDADQFMKDSAPWSHGERLCALFVANVWNPGWAKTEGHTFDVIEFIGIADSANRLALLNWLANPVWP